MSILSFQTFFALIFVTLSVVSASPLRHTGKTMLGFATRINARGAVNVVEQDRMRAQAMRQNVKLGERSTSSLGTTNAAIISTAQIGVGNPPTYHTLLIDVGSSNTWIKSSGYVPTSTSHDTGNPVSVPYGSGEFSGEEWIDTVTLKPGLVVDAQSIGVAQSCSGFDEVDGILGLGPVTLTMETVKNTFMVPTVLDNLASQGTISEEVLGIYYVPALEVNNGGVLTFGGYDSDVVTSGVNYTPITKTYPSSGYWGFDQSISYGNTTILSTTAGVVDSGTTFIAIASDAFEKYQSATGGTLDSENTGLLMVTPTQYSVLKPLSFHIGGVSYDLSPNAQIWPRSLNSYIGGTSGKIYLVVCSIGEPSGSGLDFINGLTFLERFYSVYDTSNRRVGFATTAYTQSESN